MWMLFYMFYMIVIVIDVIDRYAVAYVIKIIQWKDGNAWFTR